MIFKHWAHFTCHCFFLVALMACGCGGEPGVFHIEGEISLDGTKVGDGNDALVRFEPTGTNGNPAESFIKEGKYQVKLQPGHYKVAIRWGKKTGKKLVSKIAGPGAQTEEIVEAIPKNYNSATTLTAEVGPQKLRHDFSLKSK